MYESGPAISEDFQEGLPVGALRPEAHEPEREIKSNGREEI